MILVDTSVWIAVLRDKTGRVVAVFERLVGTDLVVLSRFNQLELLQGGERREGMAAAGRLSGYSSIS